MNDAEFLDHCERLCASPDAFGDVEFPTDVHARFVELAERFTRFSVLKPRINAAQRLGTILLTRKGIVSTTLAELRK